MPETGLTSKLNSYTNAQKVNLSDMAIMDDGIQLVAQFIRNNTQLQALEIKNNNISSKGLFSIFEALKQCNNIKHLDVQGNSLGSSYEGLEELSSLLRCAYNLEYLNLSSNSIDDQKFELIMTAVSDHQRLIMLQLKWNNLTKKGVEQFLRVLGSNSTLLYLQLTGNGGGIDSQFINKVEMRLKPNRQFNQVTRQKIKNVKWNEGVPEKYQRTNLTGSNIKNTLVPNQETRDGTIRNLEVLLEQERRTKLEIKNRLEKELEELQRQEKSMTRMLNQLDQKCNNLVIENRSLKYEGQRLHAQYSSLDNNQQMQILNHQTQISEANHAIIEIEKRYNLTLDKMKHEHELRIKEITRDWDSRIRNVEEQIRNTQFENRALQEQIAKKINELAEVKMKMQNQERLVIQKVQQEQGIRYNSRVSNLQAKLEELEQHRQLLMKRNNDLQFELSDYQNRHNEQVMQLQNELQQLKKTNQFYHSKSKDFCSVIDRLESEMRVKETALQKLQKDVNTLNDQIELKKRFNREQVEKVLVQQSKQNEKWVSEKHEQMSRIKELQKTLRLAQSENSRLRLQYQNLAEVLQLNVSKAITQVFVQNNYI